MVATRPDVISNAVAEQHLVLHEISWELYEMMVLETAEEHIQISYDQGSLEIMSPLPEHERLKYLLGFLVGILAMEKGIRMRGLGSMTVKRRDLQKGVEPDNCFYVQSVGKIEGKRTFDFSIDPPPDLVIEVDITSRSIARQPLYAAMGVPELWRHDGLRLTGLRLGLAGNYETTEMSVAFPFLRVSDLNRFLNMWPAIEESDVAIQFRDWVRQGN